MANAELIIRNGRVIDPSQGIDETADVSIADGRIVGVGKADGGAAEVIDAAGQIVCPGLIDMHVHLREPGQEDEETIASGAAAAVAGGFTSVACMPNTDPSLDTEAMIEFVYRQAKRAGLCNVFPIGAITKGRQGGELAEIGQMVRAGAVAFSDDGCGISNSSVMFRAMQYVRMFGKLVIQHCEDPDLAAGGCMNAGVMAMRLGLPGIPAMAEEMMIQRDVLIARHTGTRYHVAHISTAGAVQLVREAKAKGAPVTTEVCPHHLLLTEEKVAGYDTNYKMNPPLRSRADVDACLDGVADDTIDCLVTDHAPHGMDEKSDDFQTAPFGIVGLEVALPLFAMALVESGRLTWSRLIEKLTIRPAEILGVGKGTLKTGADADVTIFDPNAEWTVDVSQFRSKSRNCPYDGWRLKGLVTGTIVGGSVKYAMDNVAHSG
ncbi:MAG TPA: dihydroorotase [Phycisphaerae bacterium]|nr:dihydroorotase [Phycisphaerae bacterium]HRW52824.1 dihydroorotase [Phycisphaerae bacterium]